MSEFFTRTPFQVPAVHCLSVDFASGVSVDTDNGMAAKVSKKKSKHIVINADAEGKCTMSKFSKSRPFVAASVFLFKYLLQAR